MAISEDYAQIRWSRGASLILVRGVAAIIRDESGRGPLLRKGTTGLGACRTERSNRAKIQHRPSLAEVQEETGLEVRPKRIVGVFGGDGFRYQYPNGDQVEYTVISFECSNDGSPEQFDNEEAQGLDCFAPDAPGKLSADNSGHPRSP
jgi:hypothetical protein